MPSFPHSTIWLVCHLLYTYILLCLLNCNMLWSATNDYGCGAIPNKYIIIIIKRPLWLFGLLFQVVPETAITEWHYYGTMNYEDNTIFS